MTNHLRHRRALKRSTIVAVLLALPLFYVWHKQRDNIIINLIETGPVPEFLYVTDQGTATFTHHDTYRYISVIGLLPESCQQGCEKALSAMEHLSTWHDRHLVLKGDYGFKAHPVMFYAMHRGLNKDGPDGWHAITIGPSEAWLMPEPDKVLTEPMVVVISDRGRFHGTVAASDPYFHEKLTRLLSRLHSHHSLMQYLARQNLMWQQQRERGVLSN